MIVSIELFSTGPGKPSMAVDLDSVIKQLTATRLVSEQKLEPFLPPHATPASVEELLKTLIKQGLITKFQAQQVLAGKARHLVLGNYTLLDRIGAGGMGQVFKARHRRMERVVALKTLPASTMKDEEVVARFHREVIAAAKLRHPNIVAADDADEANGVHFLVMEYVDGRDLSHVVKSDGPMSVGAAVDCILQAACGLQFAHGEGVVHRDIKPSNLLLDKRGVVKILDMGLARIESNDANSRTELTGTGMMMGTVDYVAPEQAVDSKKADARSDIYSLGCTLYYLLNGRAPYMGESAMSRLLAHRDQMIPSLSELRNDVPGGLDDVFKKMIAKLPEQRHQSMTEVIVALEELQIKSGDNEVITVKTHRPAGSSVSQAAIPAKSVTSNSQSAFDATIRVQLETSETTVFGVARERSPFLKRSWILIGSAMAAISLVAVVVGVSMLPASKAKQPSERNSVPAIAATEADTKPSIQAAEMSSPATAKADTAMTKPVERDEWLDEMLKLPEPQRLNSVIEKLKELNRGFDGVFEHHVENGAVASLTLNSDDIVELLPLRALPGLRILKCIAKNKDQAKLRNLAPLHGIKLTELSLENQKPVSDLSPLAGMPLNSLSVQGTSVKDLSPIRDVGLAVLDIAGTLVEDLSPIQNMRLESLNLVNCPARNLAVLRGMPLKNILVSATTPYYELSHLKGLKLEQFGDGYAGANLGDLSLFAAMPLQAMNLTRTHISDLSPLRGKSIRSLILFDTPVTDLSPIKEMSIEYLGLSDRESFCTTHVTDFRVLKETPIKYLSLVPTVEIDLDAIRATKTLVSINGRPVEEFCQRIEQARKRVNQPLAFRDAAFKTWENQVARLSAEEQLRAVATKLAELNPGYKDDARTKIENGAVVYFDFLASHAFDISPLRVLSKLKALIFRANFFDSALDFPVDLSPIEGAMPELEIVNLGATRITDLSALRGMKLKSIDCGGAGSRLKDLGPIKGMPLEALCVRWTDVEDLTPLEGMPLREIVFTPSILSDVAPLRNLPLETLHLQQSAIRDYSPIYNKPIKELAINILSDGELEFIRSLPQLQTLNGKPVADALKAYEQIDDKNVPPYMRRKFVEWLNSARALRPEQQVVEVARKLKELNPGFEGSFEHQVENGVVKSFKLVSDDITDLSPVRALRELQTFTCIPVNKDLSKLSDLSPLLGMKLKDLTLSSQKGLTDLSPLRGMPLIKLNLIGTSVKDLSPLRQMKLLELKLQQTLVEDLAALQNMPLEHLGLVYAPVRNFKALNGSPLKGIAVGPTTPFYELNHLKNHRLEYFGTEYQGASLGDLSLFAAMPIQGLNLTRTCARDLTPLRGKAIRDLCLFDTPVTDLSPLRGSPIEALSLSESISYCTTHILDYTVLKDLQLKYLSLTPTLDIDLEIIRAMRVLESINGQPVEAYCRQIEIARDRVNRPLAFRDPAFGDWERQVVSMSPQEQVKAVDEKLVTLNPGYQGPLVVGIENGAVQSVALNSHHVCDISPLRVFRKLKALYFNANLITAGLDLPADLSPLEGVVSELELVHLSGTQVADLSPLRGANLKELSCERPNSRIKDITPLKGMSLNRLLLGWTNIVDLSPLEGMPLRELSIEKTPVSDISILRGLPLEVLRVSGTAVRDYSPLKDKEITFLGMSILRDADLEVARTLPKLKTLNYQPRDEFFEEFDRVRQQSGN